MQQAGIRSKLFHNSSVFGIPVTEPAISDLPCEFRLRRPLRDSGFLRFRFGVFVREIGEKIFKQQEENG